MLSAEQATVPEGEEEGISMLSNKLTKIKLKVKVPNFIKKNVIFYTFFTVFFILEHQKYTLNNLISK